MLFTVVCLSLVCIAGLILIDQFMDSDFWEEK